MGKLARFVTGHRETIMARWQAQVSSLPETRRLSHWQVRDDIPRLLDELASDEPVDDARDASRVHALERHAQGISLGVVAEEYGRLRACILEVASEQGIELDIAETLELHRFLDDALRFAIELHARVQRRTLEALEAVSRRVLTEGEDPDQLLTTLVDVIATMTSTDTLAVVLWDRGGARIREARGLDRVGQLIEGPRQATDLIEALFDGDRAPRVEAFELATGGRSLGVVLAMPPRSELAFAEDDRHLLRSVTTRVAALLSNARLLIRERILMGVTRTLAGCDDIDQALAGLVAMLTELLRWDAGFVWRRRAGDTWALAHGCSPASTSSSLVEGMHTLDVLPSESLLERAWQRGEVVSTHAPSHDLGGARAALATRHGVATVAAVPVSVDGQAVAVFELWTRWNRSADDVLTWLAGPLSHELDRFAARVTAQRDEREHLAALERTVGERDAALAAEREARGWLESVLDAAPVVVFMKDREGRYLFGNQRFEQVMGVSVAAAIGRTDAELFPDQPADHIARWRAHDAQVFDEGAHVDEEEHVDVDGAHRTYRTVKFPLTDPAGEPVLLCGMAYDVTDARAIEQAREEFIAILGHDLRSPLQAITMSSAVLERACHGESDARVRRAVNRIESGVERMRRLIEDLLDFARGRLGGGIPIECAPCDLHAICARVRDDDGERRGDGDARLEVACIGDTCGRWDVDRLTQLVANLVGNAQKHGRRGQPIHIRIDGSADDSVVLEVNNASDCPPASTLESLFEPFHRAERTGAHEGLGLGLYIVREIAHAHGGRVAAECDDQAGFTVRITLPRSASRATDA